MALSSNFASSERGDEEGFVTQDANGDSDLWEFGVGDAGEPVPRMGSPSPFAKQTLLGSFVEVRDLLHALRSSMLQMHF